MFIFEMILFDVIMTISGNLRISIAISGYPPAILGFLGLTRTISGYLWLSWLSWDIFISSYLRLSRALSGFSLKSLGISCFFLLSWDILDCLGIS